MKIDAILWDYDGTLVDSALKNIEITKQILSIVAPRLTGEHLPECLQSEFGYHQANHKAVNWQDLYSEFYGLTDAEIIFAGSLWAEHQMMNETPVNLFPGIVEVVNELSALPHGVCSQNSSQNIHCVLKRSGLHTVFKSIIGYDDVASHAQKPSPESGYKCLERIFSDMQNKTILYIGDHEADVQFSRNLDRLLGKSCDVISFAVIYSGATPEQWAFQPDYILSQPEELLDIVNSFV